MPSITVSDVFPVVLGSNISDSISGGVGQTGWNIGNVVAGQWGPIISKSANTGKKDLYIAHDGTNKITDCAVYIALFGENTGYTYGGNDTAANDYTNVKAQGAGSGTSKNNADNLSAGLWVDMKWDVTTVNNFDIGSRATEVFTFGKSSQGIDTLTAFPLITAGMIYNSAGETGASAPVEGEIGPAGNTVLGDTFKGQFRHYMP